MSEISKKCSMAYKVLLIKAHLILVFPSVAVLRRPAGLIAEPKPILYSLVQSLWWPQGHLLVSRKATMACDCWPKWSWSTCKKHCQQHSSLTWQPIDQPCQLLFGDVGPTEVKANWLPLDDATESLGYNGLTPTQVNFCPKSLVTAPDRREEN